MFGSDRFSISEFPFTLGRDPETVNLVVNDNTVSGEHCQLDVDGGRVIVRDLKSRNGTFLDNSRVLNITALDDGGVIRIGQSILVFHKNITPLLNPPAQRFGLVGKFHTRLLVKTLERATLSGNHLLVTGPTGSGKELVARAVHEILRQDKPTIPFVAGNSAAFGTTDEAMSTLFGVASGTYTGVNNRPGLIHQAKDGVLLLDEFHRYPLRVQNSLLRVIETGEFTPIGEMKSRRMTARIVVTTNAPPPTFGLEKDMANRLYKVLIPPLGERKADIPGIFNHLLSEELSSGSISADSVFEQLHVNHYLTLCLHDYTDTNVRALRGLARMIKGELRTGAPPQRAVQNSFSDFFDHEFNEVGRIKIKKNMIDKPQESNGSSTLILEEQPPKRESKYEKHRLLIQQAYQEANGNKAETVRELKRHGVSINARWLAYYLRKWDLPTKAQLNRGNDS